MPIMFSPFPRLQKLDDVRNAKKLVEVVILFTSIEEMGEIVCQVKP
jgi:hypothetical protein